MDLKYNHGVHLFAYWKDLVFFWPVLIEHEDLE